MVCLIFSRGKPARNTFGFPMALTVLYVLRCIAVDFVAPGVFLVLFDVLYHYFMFSAFLVHPSVMAMSVGI